MSDLPHEAFYLPAGAELVATPLTRGPWDVGCQHGGPPAALLGGAMAAFGDTADEFVMARVSLELLRPVPIGRMMLAVRGEHMGRTAQRLSAVLHADGVEVMTATGLRIRRLPLELPPQPSPEPWPAPDETTPYTFGFFQHPVGYHKAVELRLALGEWGTTPVGFWTRPRVPLVAGEQTTALQRVLTLADAQSGMGVPLDPNKWTFINPDMTLYLERAPVGPWIGFEITSRAGLAGAGLSRSVIRDHDGLVGHSAQSLVVAPR